MQNTEDSDQPQQHWALEATELAQDINIAALREKRFVAQGFLTRNVIEYTLFLSGKGKDEHCLSSLALW